LHAAIDNLLAGIPRHRHVERIAIPVRLRRLFLHRVFVTRPLPGIVAVEARGHRDEMLQRHRLLARIEIRRHRAEHRLVDRRFAADRVSCGVSRSKPWKYSSSTSLPWRAMSTL